MEKLEVDVRPLAEEELPLLERHIHGGWASPSKHRRRLDRQRDGSAAYLVAWHQDLPVGHVLLKWGGADHESIASRLEGCPDIEDLFAHPEYRSKGVGSRLLGQAESLAGHRRHPLIGLGVNIDNHRARSLYLRLGYEDSGMGQYHDRWEWTDSNGNSQWYEEDCEYLVKRLP